MNDHDLDLTLQQEEMSMQREKALHDAACVAMREDAPTLFTEIGWKLLNEWAEIRQQARDNQETLNSIPLIPSFRTLIRVLGVDPDTHTTWLEVEDSDGTRWVVVSGVLHESGSYDDPSYDEDILEYFPMSEIMAYAKDDAATLVSVNGLLCPRINFEKIVDDVKMNFYVKFKLS